MNATLTDICDYLNNYFPVERHEMTLTITGGTFTADYLQTGQYFRIIGSVFNDGVYAYPASGLHDETFTGVIVAMAVPPTVIALASEIKAWRTQFENVNSPAMSPYSSESFGNYSYSKNAASAGNSSGNPNSWQAVFASRLNKWRRLRNI